MENEELIIGTKNGLGMRFNESDVNSVGRSGSGVIGIRLRENDYVIGNNDIKRNDKIFHYLPELKPILEKIPQTFFILPREEIFNYDKVVAGIKEDVKELKEEILKK